MDFLEITSEFEHRIGNKLKFELLELNYSPYAFGSGTKAYRVHGKNLMINFDGRDGLIEVFISGRHEHYPPKRWTRIFYGPLSDFLETGIMQIKEKLD